MRKLLLATLLVLLTATANAELYFGVPSTATYFGPRGVEPTHMRGAYTVWDMARVMSRTCKTAIPYVRAPTRIAVLQPKIYRAVTHITLRIPVLRRTIYKRVIKLEPSVFEQVHQLSTDAIGKPLPKQLDNLFGEEIQLEIDTGFFSYELKDTIVTDYVRGKAKEPDTRVVMTSNTAKRILKGNQAKDKVAFFLVEKARGNVRIHTTSVPQTILYGALDFISEETSFMKTILKKDDDTLPEEELEELEEYGETLVETGGEGLATEHDCEELQVQLKDCEEIKKRIQQQEVIVNQAKQHVANKQAAYDAAKKDHENAQKDTAELEQELADAEKKLTDLFTGQGGGLSADPGADNWIGVAGSNVKIYFPASGVDEVLDVFENNYDAYKQARDDYLEAKDALEQKRDDVDIESKEQARDDAKTELDNAKKDLEGAEKRLAELQQELLDCEKHNEEVRKQLAEHECPEEQPAEEDETEGTGEETPETVSRPLRELSQHEKEEWGDNWCAPTASGISAAYFGDTLGKSMVPDKNEDGTITDDEVYDYINELGKTMHTTAERGTVFLNVVFGWMQALKNAGLDDQFEIHVYCPKAKETIDGLNERYDQDTTNEKLSTACRQLDEARKAMQDAIDRQEEIFDELDDLERQTPQSDEDKLANTQAKANLETELTNIENSGPRLQRRVTQTAEAKMLWAMVNESINKNVSDVTFHTAIDPKDIVEEMNKKSDVVTFIDGHFLASANVNASCLEGQGGTVERNADGTQDVSFIDPWNGEKLGVNFKEEDGKWCFQYHTGKKCLKCFVAIRPK